MSHAAPPLGGERRAAREPDRCDPFGQPHGLGQLPRLDLGAADPRDLRRLRPAARGDGGAEDRRHGRQLHRRRICRSTSSSCSRSSRCRSSPSRCRSGSSTTSASCSAPSIIRGRMTRRGDRRDRPAQFAGRQELQQRHPRLLLRGADGRLVRRRLARDRRQHRHRALHHPPRVLLVGASARGVGGGDRQPPRARAARVDGQEVRHSTRGPIPVNAGDAIHRSGVQMTKTLTTFSPLPRRCSPRRLERAISSLGRSPRSNAVTTAI